MSTYKIIKKMVDVLSEDEHSYMLTIARRIQQNELGLAVRQALQERADVSIADTLVDSCPRPHHLLLTGEKCPSCSHRKEKS